MDNNLHYMCMRGRCSHKNPPTPLSYCEILADSSPFWHTEEHLAMDIGSWSVLITN